MMTKMLLPVLLVFASMTAPADAQIALDVRPIAAPAETGAIALNTGGVSGMSAETWFREAGGRAAVRNVSRATLTPVLPPAGKATGAAVIVAPGGGFNFLAMDKARPARCPRSSA